MSRLEIIKLFLLNNKSSMKLFFGFGISIGLVSKIVDYYYYNFKPKNIYGGLSLLMFPAILYGIRVKSIKTPEQLKRLKFSMNLFLFCMGVIFARMLTEFIKKVNDNNNDKDGFKNLIEYYVNDKTYDNSCLKNNFNTNFKSQLFF